MKIDRDDRIEERQLRALRRTDTPSRLLRIWWRSPYADVRAAAIHKLKDQTALAYIARHERMDSLRCEAVRKLRDRELLAVIAETDENKVARYIARRKLSEKEQWDAADMDEDAERALVMMLEHAAWLDHLATGQEDSKEWW
jgi:hypothetical protein